MVHDYGINAELATAVAVVDKKYPEMDFQQNKKKKKKKRKKIR